MSETKTEGTPAADAKERGQSESQRFTPLRSYVTRARSLTDGASGKLALSPLIPVPRLQS